MKLDKKLFENIAKDAAKSPRLRKSFDLRDNDNEGCQRMLNILLPGTKTAIHKHKESSEVVVCIYGSARERLYDANGNEIECILLEAGGDVPGISIDKNCFHSLEAAGELGVVMSVKSGNYSPLNEDDLLFIC